MRKNISGTIPNATPNTTPNTTPDITPAATHNTTPASAPKAAAIAGTSQAGATYVTGALNVAGTSNVKPKVTQLPGTETEFRKNLFLETVNQKHLPELPRGSICETWEDLAVVVRCRCTVSGDEKEFASFRVSERQLEQFHMTSGEALEQATVNMSSQGFRIVPIEDMLRGLTGNTQSPEAVPQAGVPLYVCTNRDARYGASAIMAPEILSEAYELTGGSYYVLPSSVHEVLFVPESCGIPEQELQRMVAGINKTELLPPDVLSDNIYRYDGQKLSMVKADTASVSSSVSEGLKDSTAGETLTGNVPGLMAAKQADVKEKTGARTIPGLTKDGMKEKPRRSRLHM